ncbi:transcriptional regulator, XRE family with cupin sensor [Candidatus Thermokryptus mobilis]|uniref:Transcriptional regulator, XRE family with cupin sensor n=1 Tax=Candidatus Thermokryptus mobilis TaxID=1643428 RepID=A0A0S4N563_9BACT|nr:helix-turn-helix transcriptional regulator [Candidatus Thermokryptus mobilis]CUU06265.1 transcriptional regulator, XRE family with cupin sensor [Candidatus Thermokryptus mobilis]
MLKQVEVDARFIAEQLRLLRLSTDKKITEIAEASGFSVSYISQIENGKRELNYKALRRILLNGFSETLSSFFAKIFDQSTDDNSSRVYETPFKLYNEDRTVGVEILIPTNSAREIEVVKLYLNPNSSFDDEFKIDFKLYGHVQSGEILIEHSYGDMLISQGKGFVLSFFSEQNLKIRNQSEHTSEVFLIFTPPVF